MTDNCPGKTTETRSQEHENLCLGNERNTRVEKAAYPARGTQYSQCFMQSAYLNEQPAPRNHSRLKSLEMKDSFLSQKRISDFRQPMTRCYMAM
jgi:hypothetical protein